MTKTLWPIVPRQGWELRAQFFTPKVWIPDPVQYPDACWIWQRGVNGTGRGQFRLCSHSQSGSTTTAPRAAYIIFVGDLANDECACHRCDEPMCVRPSHLFRGTYAENMADMRAKGRAFYQRRRRAA